MKLFILSLMCFSFCFADEHHEKQKLVKDFLVKFEYMDSSSDENSLSAAIESFQSIAGLPVTGVINDEAIKVMSKPRCGVPDKRAATAYKWSKKNLNYFFVNYGKDLNEETVKRVIKEAFEMWQNVSPLTFQEVSFKDQADITIAFGTKKHFNCGYPFDGPGKILAHAFFPSDGRLHFDDDENFTDQTPEGTNLLRVAVHEIGHLLGLDHSNDPTAIMYPYHVSYSDDIQFHQSDINEINTLYDCVDVYPVSDCVGWKGYCATGNYVSFMQKYCKRSCNFC